MCRSSVAVDKELLMSNPKFAELLINKELYPLQKLVQQQKGNLCVCKN
jgi:hypothetical protein